MSVPREAIMQRLMHAISTFNVAVSDAEAADFHLVARLDRRSGLTSWSIYDGKKEPTEPTQS